MPRRTSAAALRTNLPLLPARDSAAPEGADALRAPTIRVEKNAPSLLLIHATDDPISDVEHSVTMYRATQQAGAAAAELHGYATGGHGSDVRAVGHPCATWTSRCVDLLRAQGMLR